MLTDIACRNAKAKESPYKLADAEGMYLLVTEKRGRYWRMDYRHAGKRKTLALGVYPEISLAQAREKRTDARRQLAAGKDPSAEIKRAREAKAHDFESVARRWFESAKAAWDHHHAGRVIRKLERDIFPEFGAKPILEIEAPEILAALRKIEARGAIDVTKRTRQYMGAIFRFAIAEGIAKRDPSADVRDALKSAPKVQHRAKLDAADLPEFLQRLAAYDGDEQTQLAIELVLLTLVRTEEVRFGRWDEIQGAEWRIPAARMKMERDHIVPLAPRAMEIMGRLRSLANGSEWILPAPTRSGVISENTMLYALYRMGYHSRLTMHGLRGTASTILNENDFNSDWIEAQLAHAPRNAVRAAYNAAKWLPQRRKMLEWWADFCGAAIRCQPK
jgi:integrase